MRASLWLAAGAMALGAHSAWATVYSYPNLTIITGPGGQAVDITATITTIVTLPGGGATVEPPDIVSLFLPDFTSLFATMDWASYCEFDAGCVISAPSEIDVSGFSGEFQWYDESQYLLLNGVPLPFDDYPAVDAQVVSGDLVFTTPPGFFTDDQEGISLTPIPEPDGFALLGVGLLGLGMVRRRT